MIKQPNISSKIFLPLQKNEFLEGLLALAVLMAINFFWFSDNLGFLKINPHPYWIVIIPIASRYGFKAGFVTAIMASIALMGMIKLGDPKFGFSEITNVRYFGTPLLFVAVGMIIGEVREVQRKKSEELSNAFKELQESFKNISGRYDALNKAKQEVDTWVVSQEHTVSTLYEAAQALKSLNEEEICPAVVELLKDFIKVEACSIYMLTENKLQLSTTLDNKENTQRPPEVDLDDGIMGQVIALGDTISINTLINSESIKSSEDQNILICAPLLSSQSNVLGVLNIEMLPFIKLNPQTIRMASLIADWCGAAIENARTYQETKDKNISDDITGAYTHQYAQERLEEEFKRAYRYRYPLSLLSFEFVDFQIFSDFVKQDILTVFSLILKNKLRDIDLLFHDEESSRYILLLPNTPSDGAEVVKTKIAQEFDAFNFRPYEGKDDRVLHFKVGVSAISENMKEYNELVTHAFERMT